MTRLPRTPVQQDNDQRRDRLARYLTKLSEQRQVMFMRSLKSDNLRFDIQKRIDEIRDQDLPQDD